MRHRKRKVRLTKSQGQRKAILMNLAKAVFQNINKLTQRMLKPKLPNHSVERIITYSKRGGLHAYRLVEAEIHDQRITKKIVEVIAPNYKNRNGGYTRIVKMLPRVGDNAPMAVFELIGDFELKVRKSKKEI